MNIEDIRINMLVKLKEYEGIYIVKEIKYSTFYKEYVVEVHKYNEERKIIEFPRNIKPINEKNKKDKLEIMFDGKKTIAKYDNNKAIAKCNPNDKYDKFIGAVVALDRLFMNIKEPIFLNQETAIMKMCEAIELEEDRPFIIVNKKSGSNYGIYKFKGKKIIDIEDNTDHTREVIGAFVSGHFGIKYLSRIKIY